MSVAGFPDVAQAENVEDRRECYYLGNTVWYGTTRNKMWYHYRQEEESVPSLPIEDPIPNQSNLNIFNFNE